MSDVLCLYVYHGSDRVGLVEGASSLQWMPAWDNPGEFKLVCAASEQNRVLLRRWDTLYNPDTPGMAAVITCIKTEQDAMTVRGQFSLCRFAQRVARGSRTVTDAAAGLLSICRENLRGLPVTVPEQAGFAAPCEETVEWTDCCTAITQLAKAGEFGVRVRFDPSSAAETLELRQGADRSRPGSDGYRGYFGTRMQNLANVALDDDGSGYANVVLCGGEVRDGQVREIVEVGDAEAAGKDRHELWVDGSGVSHSYQVQNADGTMATAEYSDAEYTRALTNYAAKALLSHLGGKTLRATATDRLLHYGEDYDLGDIVPLRVPEMGLTARARVCSVRLVYEHTGRIVEPVFDNITLGGEET